MDSIVFGRFIGKTCMSILFCNNFGSLKSTILKLHQEKQICINKVKRPMYNYS